jgi:phosphate transport system protein
MFTNAPQNLPQMTTHLEESLQRDFDRLQTLIGSMADVAGGMLRDCITAFRNGDRELASLIILRDQRVDALEKQIDSLCLEFLVRHQPAGTHLRFAYSALQINFELERIGDYAESIARQIIKLIDLGCHVPTELFGEITSSSLSMLRNAVNAFVRQDAALAEATEQIEEQVDTLRNQINSELLHLVQSNQLPLAALTPLMTIARRFERVSDQAKGICQETLYLCTGEYAKHTGAPIYRVLFVDEGHGCLARLATSLGNGLGRSDVQFTNATLDPKPLAPNVVAFLKERGLSNPSAPAFNEIPNLAEFQLVIAFGSGLGRKLPPPSRKAVQLEWDIPDPCRAPAPVEALPGSWENASLTLSTHLARLIKNLTGQENPQIQ